MIRTILTVGLAASFAANAPAQPARGQSSRYAPIPLSAGTASQCHLPAAPVDAQLIVFSAYEADAISSAVIGNQDIETNLMEVMIEPGTTPLYVVLASFESMVWRFTGATDRVAQVVISSQRGDRNAWRAPADHKSTPRPQPAVLVPSFSGTISVPASKVHIASIGCPRYFSSLEGQEGLAAYAFVETQLGRAPDALFATYSAAGVVLPSGTMSRAERAPAPRGFDPNTWQEAVRFWRGGLVRVDPEAVTAAVTVAPYEVLPSQMGISQLVGSGALQPDGSRGFRVVRPIAHMPPSMGGAHSVTLTFARGIPVPPGDPGHSCIVREDTGSEVGATCHR